MIPWIFPKIAGGGEIVDFFPPPKPRNFAFKEGRAGMMKYFFCAAFRSVNWIPSLIVPNFWKHEISKNFRKVIGFTTGRPPWWHKTFLKIETNAGKLRKKSDTSRKVPKMCAMNLSILKTLDFTTVFHENSMSLRSFQFKKVPWKSFFGDSVTCVQEIWGQVCFSVFKTWILTDFNRRQI